MINKPLLIILFVLLLSACRVPELIPAESPVLTATEESKIETSKPAPPTALPATIEPIQLPTKDNQIMTPPVIPPASSDLLDDLIEQAKQDLAQRLSISLDEIQVVQAGEVVWPDTSLGCPQSGMAYLTVLTPGYLVVLNANDWAYEYHAGKDARLFYCQNPTPPTSGGEVDQ